jgi:hypothetical protein
MLNLFNRINIKFDDENGFVIINTINMELPVTMTIEDSLKDKDIVKLLKSIDIFKMGVYCSQCQSSSITKINDNSITGKIKLIEIKNDGFIRYKNNSNGMIEKDHVNHVINSRVLDNFSKNDIFKMGLMTGLFTKV